MNFERFTAWRMIKSVPEKGAGRGGAVNPIIRIAVAAIALGVTVMITALSILTGFQKEIREKVIGFGSHIQITSFGETNERTFISPISIDQPFYPHIDTLPEVNNIQIFGIKPGVLKKDEEISGVIFKGIGSDFNDRFFQGNMVSGRVPKPIDGKRNDSVLISSEIARRMQLEVSDDLVVFFVKNDRPRPRKFTVAGIYKTGMEGFDDVMMLGDIAHVRSINGWGEDMVTGFEINLNRFKDLEIMDELIYEHIPFDLKSTTIREKHPDIFGWLELQDMNVIIIVILIILVSGINMTSALLVMILERTGMIGILKTLGAGDKSIRKIFLYNAAYLILKGLFYGNIAGLSLVLLQKYTGIIKLPEESYYLSYVPVYIDWGDLLLLNLGTLILCTSILILPTFVITKINPIKAIRFD